MRSKEDGSPVRPATVNTYVAAVKSFLGFAHHVGFTRFNAGPLIKLKKAPRQIAQRIMSEVQIALLIRAAKTVRDRLMFDLAYFGGLRVSELVSLTWAQVIRRDSGEAQLSIVGKGSKSREVLIPAVIATRRFCQPRHCAGVGACVVWQPGSSVPSILSSKRRPSAPASTSPIRFTGCATPMRRTPSTTAGVVDKQLCPKGVISTPAGHTPTTEVNL